MKDQLIIPDKINVGFQNRQGTYTGKLAYVIYYDKKGVLRKEKSWQSWRDHKIKPLEFENTPTSGFVLNKGVGGARESYGWNARNEYIRVYDPRDFEFEISLANLLFILRECNCSKGKGLEGNFVYSWSGTELVLLPENSQEYKNSKNFTELQTVSVKAKDLIPGATYINKKQEPLIYLGRFVRHSIRTNIDGKYEGKSEHKHVFWREKGKESWDKAGFAFVEPKNIAAIQSDIIVPNYAELVQKYNKTKYGSKPVRLFTKKAENERVWTYQESEGTYVQCNSYNDHYYGQQITFNFRVSIKDDMLVFDRINQYWFKSGRRSYGSQTTTHEYVEPTKQELWVELESGQKFKVGQTGYNPRYYNDDNRKEIG